MLTQVYCYQDKEKKLHFVWESADIKDMSDDDDMTFIEVFDGMIHTDNETFKEILISI